MNILNKINIHITTYIIIFLSTITGQFRNFTILFIIILIHELGHILASKIFDVKINKINILPFGGNIDFDIKLNMQTYKEFIILIMGPIFQIIGTILIINLPLITYNEAIQIKNFSCSLLLFNLVPIYPLDGSKLVFLVLNNIMSYKKSHIFLIAISFTSIILMTIYFLDFTFKIIIFFLIYKTYEQYKNHYNIINKFLLERYLNPQKNKYIKIIKKINIYKIWKNRYNIFINNKNYITEKELLDSHFKNKKIY